MYSKYQNRPFKGYYDLHGIQKSDVSPLVNHLYSHHLENNLSNKDLIMTFNVGKRLHSTNLDKNGKTPLRQAFIQLNKTQPYIKVK